MSLPHALLGLINYRPSTGYELRATFSESVQFFWNATLPQIYRTLNQMESQGWLTVKVEPQEGKPSRKVYSITDEGRRELTRWLFSKPDVMPERNPLLIKVFFGRMVHPEALTKIIEGYQRYHSRLLEQYESETGNVIQHYAETCNSPEDSVFWKLTLDFGQRFSKMVVEWCDYVLETINKTPDSPGDTRQKGDQEGGGTKRGTPRGIRKGRKKD